MTNTAPGDAPAFPCKVSHEQFQFANSEFTGMTLRQYAAIHAIHAMQGLLAGMYMQPSPKLVAKMAVSHADALLDALSSGAGS